ncbi:hypothetical protein TrRE_jg11796 [Triparma retinervis]|uniref:EamA domain-containing protein n=1 Tax=Triparma retinervis TaxID=2557542 RepID=A0A9W7CDA0_9STRA|nr:hypothetical protein TrRE_jg11796 [Triparma retinervis]
MFDSNIPELVLLSVPITWGTYTPVVKLLYNQPYPVPGIIFSTCYYAVAAVTLNAAKNIFISPTSSSPTSSSPTSSSPTSSTTEGKEPSPLAGAELAGYLFVANILQVIGLQTTSAIVAAFIVQLTTIFTPLLEGLRGGSVSPRTWFSCTAAFLGVVLMTLSQSTTPTSTLSISPSSLTGDLLILASSILYSLHVLRLGDISKSCSPLSLASSKASYELLPTASAPSPQPRPT